MAFLSPLEKAADRVGYWSPITASLYWCENKYIFTTYIAEFANTISNAFFILLAIYGAYRSYAEKLPQRFYVLYLGIASVGVGSFLFHMTLKYEAQMLDELPMIYTAAAMTYAVCETSPGYDSRSKRFRVLLPASLILGVIFITVAYAWNQNPVFHQVAYGLIQGLSTFRVIYLLFSSSSPLATSDTSRHQRSQIRTTYAIGTVTFLSGFAIWNVDNIFCRQLRALRSQVGYPVAFLLEGHAWWHLLTGAGAYYLVVACAVLVLSIKEDPANFVFEGRIVPWVKRIAPYKAGPVKKVKRKSLGLTNGKSKTA